MLDPDSARIRSLFGDDEDSDRDPEPLTLILVVRSELACLYSGGLALGRDDKEIR